MVTHMLRIRGYPAGDVTRDLPGLPGQLHGAVEVAGVNSGEAEHAQGTHLAGREAKLPGRGQRTAGIPGRLGDPAQVQQGYRPVGQAVSHRRRRHCDPGGGDWNLPDRPDEAPQGNSARSLAQEDSQPETAISLPNVTGR